MMNLIYLIEFVDDLDYPDWNTRNMNNTESVFEKLLLIRQEKKIQKT